VWELRWNLDPTRVTTVTEWPEAFGPYLRSHAGMEQDDRFQVVLRGIARGQQGPAQDLNAVIDWIDHNLTYDHVDASLRADAKHAFTKRRGHCSDYHGLCTTMARTLGYPARLTYGMAMFAKNSPSHCKMEAFLPPYGWVSFDLSETQKMVKRIARDENLDATGKEQLCRAAKERLKSGFRDNTWLLITRGTNYDLVPPASKPVCVVRTIYAEADGEALPDPDPANVQKREFAWMTVGRFEADKPVSYPFKDLQSLRAWVCSPGVYEEYDGVYGKGKQKLMVAAGSPGELGLLKVIAEKFVADQDATVYWRKAGSGKSLELLRDGKVNAVMVHAPEAERKAVEEGWATRRVLFGANEFLLVGPAKDPAGIRSAKSVAEAYSRIAANGSRFLSRGDNSGTHQKELAIWRHAGIVPKGAWYVIAGNYMAATLRQANAEKAYFMVDSSTWIALRDETPNLKVLLRGDRSLVNVYHALCRPRQTTPAGSLAAKFVDFLAGPEAQQLLRDFGMKQFGESLYRDARYAKEFE